MKDILTHIKKELTKSAIIAGFMTIFIILLIIIAYITNYKS